MSRHARHAQRGGHDVPSWAQKAAAEHEAAERHEERRNHNRRLRRATALGVFLGAASLLVPNTLSTEPMPKTAAEAPASPKPTPKPSKTEKPAPKPSTAPKVPYISLERPRAPRNMDAITDATIEVVSPVNTNLAYFGSGTILRTDVGKVVMTAAHVTEAQNTKCANNSVSYPSTSQLPAESGLFKAVTPAEKLKHYPDGTSNYNANTYNNGLDAALVIPMYDRVFDGRPSLAVQDKVSAKPGDQLFSVGYGPRSEEYNPNPLSDDFTETEPQIIPGTVLKQEGGKITFITGIEGYGLRADDDVRQGDSGGTTIDMHGNYLGDMVAGGDNLYGEDIELAYGVDLPQGAEDEWYTFGVTQVIDQQTVKSLMQKTVECTA
ncbi:MAG TPA: trypsin-like peptidase domain-containing protein [Candidatus Saccharimonadales bacterium]|nr:trypsin-like peptidase domain-containing protein [Candidatus Saccharimonadales bacterium]